MNLAFTEDQIVLLILALIFLIAIIVVAIQWRKSNESKNKVQLLEKETELKKIELVEKDLESKRRKEDMTELSDEEKQRILDIRANTSKIMAKASLLSNEVNERVEQLEAKNELLKLQKLSEKLDKKESEIEKSLKK